MNLINNSKYHLINFIHKNIKETEIFGFFF